MTPKELEQRVSEFARVVVLFCMPLIGNNDTEDLVRQLLKSGTGVNANYGSAREARTRDEFVSKLGQVVDDVTESRRWLRLFRDTKLFQDEEHFAWLLGEADELTKIFAKSYRTAKANNERRKAAEKLARRRQKR
jgi:four helix bundle protein